MPDGDKYLFIDGAYLRERYDSTVPRWVGGPAELDLGKVKNAAGALKCFYYDCADIRRDGESEKDYQARRDEQDRLFAKFRRTYGTHVRLGTLTGAKKKARQKQVDILLAVDMLTHAARKNLGEAVLIAGDQDFTPLVESLVYLGVFVTVWGDPRSTSATLIDAADAYLPISFRWYVSWAEERQVRHLPRGVFARGVGPRNVRQTLTEGKVGGLPAKLYEEPGECVLNVEDAEGVCHITHPDRVRCLLFAELEFGEVSGFA